MADVATAEKLEVEKVARTEASEKAEKEAKELQTAKNNFVDTANVIGESTPAVHTLSDGRKVTITKIKVRDLGRYMQLVSTVFEQLGISSFTEEDTSKKLNNLFSNPMMMLQALGKMADPLINALSELTSLSADDFGDLEIEEAFDLGTAIWEVNQSFLLQVARMLKTTSTTGANSE